MTIPSLPEIVKPENDSLFVIFSGISRIFFHLLQRGWTKTLVEFSQLSAIILSTALVFPNGQILLARYVVYFLVAWNLGTMNYDIISSYTSCKPMHRCLLCVPFHLHIFCTFLFCCSQAILAGQSYPILGKWDTL